MFMTFKVGRVIWKLRNKRMHKLNFVKIISTPEKMALRKWKDKLPLGTAPFTCMSGRDAERVYQTVPVSFCVNTNSAHLGRNAPIRLRV